MAQVAPARVSAPGHRVVLTAFIGILYWTAHTMIRPLVGPEVIAQGGSANLASITLAAFAVLPTIVAIPIGSFTDRIGSRRMLVVGTILMIGGGLLLATPTGLPGLVLSQVVAGVGTLMAWVSLQATITASGGDESPDRRNARLATFSLYLAAGQALGPLLGGLLAEAYGRSAAFAAFTGLSSVLLVLAFFSQGPTRREVSEASSWREAVSSYPAAARLGRRPVVGVAVVVSFTALVGLDLRNAFVPLLLGPLGYDAGEIGVVLSVAAAAAFCSRPFFPWAMRRLSPAAMVGLVLGVAALSGIAFAAVSSFPALLAVAGVHGFALGFAQPLTLAMMADYTAPGERGLGSGLRSMANRAAQFANPAVMGAATAVGGLTAGFVAVGAGTVAVTGWCIWRLGRRPPGPLHPVDDQIDP